MIATTVDVVSPETLSSDERDAWRRLRATRQEYATPFFSLAFVDAVQWARGDVLVAVLRRGSESVGFFPFHKVGGVAVPVGRYFNDGHNVIASPATSVDWIWLLKQCDVKAFDFHALVGANPRNRMEQGYGTVQSFSAQLGDDSTAFLDQLCRQHRTIRRQSQKSRKLSREIGPITVELDCRDDALLRRTIEWKRDQYRRTHILDLFTPDWTRGLLHRLHQVPHPTAPAAGAPAAGAAHDDARGLLSVLRAGERVVAAHYGLLDGDMMHYWFPCYDPEFSVYSPGTALFTEIVRESSSFGIRCIDMGYGEQPYKRKQTDLTTTVTFGCISRSGFYCRRKSLEHHAVNFMKMIPLKEPLKKAVRWLRPEAGISKLN
jgi:CelD/BcsL family acetyltransferase involved in cellulose biosynthesis